MRTAAALIFALAATSTVVACRHHDRDDDTDYQVTPAGAWSSDTTLHGGDLRIVDERNSVELALIGDSISGGLSRRTLDKIKRETDTTHIQGNGFGASLEKLIKGTVVSALGTRITIPVKDVTDIRYEDGTLRITTKGSKGHLFEHTKVNDHNAMESFRPVDAERFVAAVQARQRQLGMR